MWIWIGRGIRLTGRVMMRMEILMLMMMSVGVHGSRNWTACALVNLKPMFLSLFESARTLIVSMGRLRSATTPSASNGRRSFSNLNPSKQETQQIYHRRQIIQLTLTLLSILIPITRTLVLLMIVMIILMPEIKMSVSPTSACRQKMTN
eukprot:TRINITY_DN1545_c0_g1::TRINITY_DN1545_c0_g1_i1::g.28224::m.28224 TRINITY_DN1545_c0_g1::TRINITY_DN1545_c0_g1_i1::g.28224  ORF type:complete len:149 (+),score=-10.77,TMEM154/PF15102.1/0.058,DUF4231/PF14015.1/0.12 TRINITY_DN1545_c0_g1_i1:920-1366(+)